jgi:hypothetical protein
MKIKLFLSLLLWLVLISPANQAEPTYKPYLMANVIPTEIKTKLKEQNFEIIGEYKPFADVLIIIITDETLKKVAVQSDFGGYGAIQRIAITGDDQIFYTNPTYMAHIYRLNNDLAEVTARLQKALGNKGELGSKEGMTKTQLRNYKYMWGMPDFEDQIELVAHENYEKAIHIVETGLKSGKGGTKFIYRLDMPEKDETVFGMALTEGEGADKPIMETLEKMTNAAYMPYEILVSENKVYMLHGRFRIAFSFPDLKMGTFIMKIRRAPRSIEKAARAAAQ